MDMENQSLIIIDEGKKPFDMPCIDAVVGNDLHHVKGMHLLPTLERENAQLHTFK